MNYTYEILRNPTVQHHGSVHDRRTEKQRMKSIKLFYKCCLSRIIDQAVADFKVTFSMRNSESSTFAPSNAPLLTVLIVTRVVELFAAVIGSTAPFVRVGFEGHGYRAEIVTFAKKNRRRVFGPFTGRSNSS